MTGSGLETVRFADGKEPGALRTIGEVAAAFGLKTHILRYWEEQFPMLRPLKRSGGRRLYRPEDVALVARIAGMVNAQGYTLKGARAAISGGGAAADKPAATITPDAQMLASLHRIRARLAAALAA